MKSYFKEYLPILLIIKGEQKSKGRNCLKIQLLGRLRQEDREFEAKLGKRVRYQPPNK
jgi:hypothetical protein